MKNKRFISILSLLLVAMVLCVSGCVTLPAKIIYENMTITEEPAASPVAEADYTNMHLKVRALDSGFDIFVPTEGTNWGYRYGPAIMLHEDGRSVDAWFASPADNSKKQEMDWFTYRHSDDGGYTWTDEKVVLYPSPGTLDELSVCDPAVFYYDGYYYLGYTSTIDGTGGGLCNSTFIARSENPDGPFEKWNGSGWGGDPWPMIYYTGPATSWGEGEPSFVILDGTLYVYITSDTASLNGERIKTTKVYTADVTDENWPANLEYQGDAINRWGFDETGYDLTDADSVDVAYVEKYKKFVAIGTNRRFSERSCIIYYESNDGLTFTRVSEINDSIMCGSHNAGIMKDGNGHIKEGDRMMIGYAYAGYNNATWGYWATRFTPIEITVTDYPDITELSLENIKEHILTKKPTDEPWPIALSTYPREYIKTVGKGIINFDIYWYDTDYKATKIRDASVVTFSDYDESIISINGLKATPLKVGTTSVTVKYKDLTQTFLVRVLPEGIFGSGWNEEMTEFRSTVDEYTISLSQQEATQIRSLATLINGNFCELYNRNDSPIGLEYGRVKFEVADKEICSVNAKCYIIPKSVGETTVTVKYNDFSYDVKVKVVE